jgi:hypothetical protein
MVGVCFPAINFRTGYFGSGRVAAARSTVAKDNTTSPPTRQSPTRPHCTEYRLARGQGRQHAHRRLPRSYRRRQAAQRERRAEEMVEHFDGEETSRRDEGSQEAKRPFNRPSRARPATSSERVQTPARPSPRCLRSTCRSPTSTSARAPASRTRPSLQHARPAGVLRRVRHIGYPGDAVITNTGSVKVAAGKPPPRSAACANGRRRVRLKYTIENPAHADIRVLAARHLQRS